MGPNCCKSRAQNGRGFLQKRGRKKGEFSSSQGRQEAGILQTAGSKTCLGRQGSAGAAAMREALPGAPSISNLSVNLPLICLKEM